MKDFEVKYTKEHQEKDVNWVKKHWFLLMAVLTVFAGVSVIYILKPVNTKVPKPDTTIKADVKQAVTDYSQKVKDLETKISIEIKEKNSLKDQLRIAQARNKYLAQKFTKSEPEQTENVNTAQDYAEITTSAAQSDSLCNEAIQQYEKIINLKDSVITTQKATGQAILKSFNELAYNSTLKDTDIKSLNRKLRWQKVQKYGTWAIVAGVLVKVLILK